LSSIPAKAAAKLVLRMCAKIRDQRTKWIVLQFSERKNADIIARKTVFLPFLFSESLKKQKA